MAWPTQESEIKGMPCGEFARASYEVMTPEVEAALKRLILPYHVELEALTDGDPELEQTLGGLLIIAANYGANARQREVEGRTVDT